MNLKTLDQLKALDREQLIVYAYDLSQAEGAIEVFKHRFKENKAVAVLIKDEPISYMNGTAYDLLGLILVCMEKIAENMEVPLRQLLTEFLNSTKETLPCLPSSTPNQLDSPDQPS